MIENDAAAALGRAAQDAGVAAMLGGNLFARLGMNPALAGITDKAERGKVVNSAWRRYGTVNSLSLVAVVGGWAGARATETDDRYLTERERTLARAKDAAVAAVAVTGLAAAVEGVRFGASAPGGAVPLDSGSAPAAETPARAASLKRALNVLGSANALAGLALVAINAALSQESFRRPPPRRLLKRRY